MSTRLHGKLRENIVHAIRREEMRRARTAVAVSLLAMGGSIVGVVVSVRASILALSQSGFFSYISLLFSDADMVARYSREFALSIVEALPLLAITFALMACALFLVSLRMLAANTGGALTLAHA